MNIINPNELKDADTCHIIDVRSPGEYWQEYIPQSHNIPLDQLTEHLDDLAGMEYLILSCQSGRRAQKACEVLAATGRVQQMSVLQDGLNGWKQAGRKTIRSRAGLSVMQQTQLVIGIMILAGLFVPALWIFPYIAGVGLLIAGLTNTCMLAMLIGRMPWNRLSQPKNQCSLN